ncbi:universal stress protein [Methylocystis sp.]|uniref:universal stress protein n=1 Tax=Methylocystis sp. TaxID=1911079 RepID=UPI0025FB46F2|nr:universal stress protein [Methylocystis sp.]
MYRKILLPIDITERAMTDSTIAVAQGLAKAFDSDMRLVNVQSLLPISFLDYVPENFDLQVRQGLEKEIAAVAARIDCAPERVSTTLLFGPVYQKVLAEAEEWGADLIVLCSHRPGMDRFLIGSNATTIVNHANCSVLVVRGASP